MRVQVIFLLIFVGSVWCKKSDIIIFDTNVCIISLKLFEILSAEIFKQSPTKTQPTYKDIWTKFNGSDSVDIIMNRYLSEEDRFQLKKSIIITKLILDLEENRSQTEIHIPVYSYNEAVNGITSKMTKDTIFFHDGYDEFFKSIPIKTTVDDRLLIKALDYPNKYRSDESNTLFSIMHDFLTKTITTNRNLKQLINYMNKDITNKKKETEARLSDLNVICENLETKIRLWDKPMKMFLSNNGIFDYKSDTEQLSSVVGKISTFYRDKFTEIDFSDPIDVISKRLIKSKEEFDFFDLQIYLYAMEKDAYILTVNTQAFQEINDPVFLNYFKDIKILNPNINLIELADLDRSIDCKTTMERVLERAFENDYKMLTNLKSIKNLHRVHLDATELHLMFNNIFTEIRQHLPNGKNLKRTLNDVGFINALDLLKIVDNRVKIDQQTLFNSYSVKVIQNQINCLIFIDKFIFHSTLSIDDFIKPKPSIDSIPKSLNFDKQLVEGVKMGISNENHNLIEFLKIFKDNNESVRVEAGKYAKMLYFESNFKRESLIKAVESGMLFN